MVRSAKCRIAYNGYVTQTRDDISLHNSTVGLKPIALAYSQLPFRVRLQFNLQPSTSPAEVAPEFSVSPEPLHRFRPIRI